MARNRMHRGLVALSASAIAAVYMAGYLRTQAADATIAAADPVLTASPTVQVTVAAPPAATATPAPPAVARLQARTAPQSSSAPAAQAPTPVPTQTRAQTQPPSQSVQAAYQDGTYTGQGTSRRGDVWVQVQVVGGRVANVSITRSTLQYPLRDIAGLPQQVIDRQDAQVDTVSRATYSSMAFRQAVTQALASAKAG
jgi:uncharacterized protein with FMN-binding domain